MASNGDSPRAEPIAIIGSGCRFPGESSSPSKLWELLKEPRDVLREIPADRFGAQGYYHQDSQRPGHSNVKHSYFLSENIREFDAQFFNIKAVEAAAMDPQHRLLLETVYEGVDAAGLRLEDLKGSDTSVYVGLMYGDYEALQLRDLDHLPTYHETGNARSLASNRISYFFDWHGESLTVDTACSSSMVAIHQATRALRAGEAQVAVAAGTNLLIGPEHYVAESKLKMLSPDGRSRMWDVAANGYARGEGVAALVLKPLRAALAAGDHIQCVIRETGVNQDGRSQGITMPSADAQSALIRETYRKAGLRPHIPAERCQYFEAHGTGTPAGDPVEAEAISQAFFAQSDDTTTADPLWVGSIKTVIGHTESTAGIAGVLKVALAMQHGFIPPNMHFKNLNPDVEPFYTHLRIPEKLTPWPETKGPRRASVNSFGFGGTNAHIILESFAPVSPPKQQQQQPNITFSPFIFSAHTKKSLVANLSATADYLDAHPDTLLANLAWTLRTRRSLLPVRVSLPASSLEELKSSLRDGQNLNTTTSSLQRHGPKRVLGVFTGQGAHYARMAAELIETEHSRFVSDILAELDAHLQSLPSSDRPTWSLREEILAPAEESRLGDATRAQPVCTAIQIILIKLYRLTGLDFDAVVGHSSGEIAAAYAAGYLSAKDALYIAYYRGIAAKLARGPRGKGAMMAVGTSQEDAEELLSEFKGRVIVAAVNSSTSVTLSGDEDAIGEIQAIMEDENKFCHRLKVDTAYHSHHMHPCSETYLTALAKHRIAVQEPTCRWFSSVFPDADLSGLEGPYWNDNMVQPVLFRQAVSKACSSGAFDVAIEVGPHPGLKRPVVSTYQESWQTAIPYTGLLQRQTDSIRSFSAAIGFFETEAGIHAPTLEKYESTMGGARPSHVISDLPTYHWQHEREYWSESRVSSQLRYRERPVHPLLGHLTQNSSHQLCFRNHLRVEDIPWVSHHRIQGQMVFPAAGYVATALECIPFLTTQAMEIVELKDFKLHQALIFDESDSGVEVTVSVNDIERDDKNITARFAYSATTHKELQMFASGAFNIMLGDETNTLPIWQSRESNMQKINADHFYSAASKLGYGYTGPFTGLSDMHRKFRRTSGLLDTLDDSYLVHPGTLDCALQAALLAFSYPQDGELWAIHMPTEIETIRLDTSCVHDWNRTEHVAVRADMTSNLTSSGFTAEVAISNDTQDRVAMHIENVRFMPLGKATATDDKRLFHGTRWTLAEPDVELYPRTATSEQKDLAYVLERASSFYLRQVSKNFANANLSDPAHKSYLNFANHVTKTSAEGTHPYVKKEWASDKLEDIVSLTRPFADLPEVQLMHVVGEKMPQAMRGETMIIEHLMQGDLWEDYHSDGIGLWKVTQELALTVQQLSASNSRMDILEIGAGTGGATRHILPLIEDQFSSYTYTDISPAFFEKAQNIFQPWKHRMKFSVLDLEKDTAAQGFREQSYDLVVGSLVVHATRSLEVTLRKARSLLKPGGYIILSEITNNDMVRGTFIFGCLPGWWLGAHEGRTLSPSVPPSEWDSVLRQSGFSGIDTMSVETDSLPFGMSVLVSQAIDDQLQFLRDPLVPGAGLKESLKHLCLIGGKALRTSRLANDIKKTLGPFCGSVSLNQSLEDLDVSRVGDNTTVVVMADLDRPVFKDLTPNRFEGLKQVLSRAQSIVWVTENRRTKNPYANMMIGFVRSVLWEDPRLKIQFLDFEECEPVSRVIAESVLRFEASRQTSKTPETELVYTAQGRLLVPRLHPLNDANDRHSSTRRSIEKTFSPHETPLAICRGTDWRVLEGPRAETGDLNLKITHSMLFRIKTSQGYGHLALGSSADKQYLVLTESAVSLISLPTNKAVSCSVRPGSETQFLTLVANQLLAAQAMIGLRKGDLLVVSNPSATTAKYLDAEARTCGVSIMYTTHSSKQASRHGWTHIHKYLGESRRRELFPQEVARFVDMSIDSANSELYPGSPRRHDLFQYPSTNAVPNCLAIDAVSEACATASKALEESEYPSNEVSLESLTTSTLDVFSAVNWVLAPQVSVAVQPVQITLNPNRTYWLAGLSGSLGLSLCEWMISRGARHLVISSRNASVSSSWMEEVGRMAEVRVVKNDLTDFDAVQRLYQDISTTMPPVAGVAQGAMVLRDAASWDMTYEEMAAALGPKVQGSINLDTLLKDQPLDFLVFFSSALTYGGNPGQSNYTAANMFMSGLAQERRARGQAASVIGIGTVLGVGYVTQELDQSKSRALYNRGYGSMSESDLHYLVAEAIAASDPSYAGSSEIISALRRVPISDPTRPSWHMNPMFNCLTEENDEKEQSSSSSKTIVSVKEQLLQAKTHEDVHNVIIDTLTKELRSVLHLDSDVEISKSARADELGFDSLIAVKIRSWFSTNFEVNIPTLKILRGASVGELVDHTQKSLPTSLIPNVSDSGQSQPAEMVAAENTPAEKVTFAIDTPTSSVSATDIDYSTLQHTLQSTAQGSEISEMSEDEEPKKAEETSEDKESKKALAPVEIELERSGPLSYAQSMFWFVHNLLEDRTTLNCAFSFRLSGHISTRNLSRAVAMLGQRHEALRTHFRLDAGTPVQVVARSSRLKLEVKEYSTHDEVMKEFAALRNHLYDLENGETLRIILMSGGPDEHYLLIGYHHLIFDGACHYPLMADLENAYNWTPFEAGVRQYLDFSNEQHRCAEDGTWETGLAFWSREFATVPEPLPLHRSQLPHRVTLTRYANSKSEFRVDETLGKQLRDFGRTHRVTMFQIYLAAFKVLLFRLLEVSDICIGMADAGRRDRDTQISIGPYLNVVPLRLQASPKETFVDAVQSARNKTFEVMEHPVPLEAILNELQVIRTPAHSPLFQAFINYLENSIEEELTFCDCAATMEEPDPAQLSYDITLSVIGKPSGEARIFLGGQTSLYDDQACALMAHGLEDILHEFVTSPNQMIGREWKSRPEDLQAALQLGQGPTHDVHTETLIHHFEQVVGECGSRTAVRDGRLVRSYSELSKRVDMIASHLLKSVGHGSRVGIYQKPSVEWIEAFLAILKIGATCVPLDTNTPYARLAAIVASGVDTVIFNESTTDTVKELHLPSHVRVIDVSHVENSQEVKIQASSQDVAIILYTSGSTGTPKGVKLSHSNLVFAFDRSALEYTPRQTDAVLQQTAYSFDLSIIQIFLAFTAGASLCVAAADVRADAHALIQFIRDTQVTITFATPTEYKHWISRENVATLEESSLEVCMTGGEAVTEPLLHLFRGINLPKLRLFNWYGPTETACGSTESELAFREPDVFSGGIPAGRPKPNESIYIVDEHMRLQPTGFSGEVVIAGSGVSPGYLDDEKTKAAFVPNTFSSEYVQRGWRTMYRTGDRGRLAPDGTLHLEGRIAGDTQVKLNGVRFDLREVELAVLKEAQGNFLDAAASIRRSDAASFLVVHVSTTSQEDWSQLSRGILERLPLPRAARPSAIIPVERLPHTVSGKLDRKAVALLQVSYVKTQDDVALSAEEIEISSLWQQVIPSEVWELNQLEPDSDFFHVGGTSLSLMALRNKLRDHYTIDLNLIDLFQSSALHSMAKLVHGKTGEVASVNWEEETQANLAGDYSIQNSTTLARPRTIIVTGGTGFLGRYIVDALVALDHVDEVICIGVRNPPLPKSKVVYYQGDLRLPYVGLDKDIAHQLFARADAIVHNGADVSHLKTYHSLRAANFQATKELVALCVPRQIPFHFVSTAGVVLYANQDSAPEASVRNSPPPVDGMYGYLASKWASEVYLENVHQRYKLPVWLHRPSSVIRPESTGLGNTSRPDVTQNMLGYSELLGAIPHAPGLRGTIDLVHPESVVSTMVKDISENEKHRCPRYRHEAGDIILEISQLAQVLQEREKKPFESIPLRDWVTRAKQIGLSSEMAAVWGRLEGMTESAFPRLEKGD